MLKKILLTAALTLPASLWAAQPHVLLETSLGNIELELDAEQAPISVENFLGYVDSGHYNGTVFHRIIRGFMIQGGGFDANGKQLSTRAPIRNEANNGLRNNRGTIAMARTSDPHSATAQFFINHSDNHNLNYNPRSAGYAVFGKVVSGMDVVDSIAEVRTGYQDAPLTPVMINRVSRVAAAAE